MFRPLTAPPHGGHHRCCWCLPLPRGVAFIAGFYLAYTLSVTAAAAAGAALLATSRARTALTVVAVAAAAAACCAGLLLLGRLRQRPPLLLCWIIYYGCVLAAEAVSLVALIVAYETESDSVLNDICRPSGGRRQCSWRFLRYLWLWLAVEVYWWVCVILLYRRWQQPPPPPPAEGTVPVYGLHDGNTAPVHVQYAAKPAPAAPATPTGHK